MATHPERLLSYLRRLVTGPSSEPLTDALLLDRIVHRKDENAFATLVERHGAMVLGVCRRILHNTIPQFRNRMVLSRSANPSRQVRRVKKTE